MRFHEEKPILVASRRISFSRQLSTWADYTQIQVWATEQPIMFCCTQAVLAKKDAANTSSPFLVCLWMYKHCEITNHLVPPTSTVQHKTLSSPSMGMGTMLSPQGWEWHLAASAMTQQEAGCIDLLSPRHAGWWRKAGQWHPRLENRSCHSASSVPEEDMKAGFGHTALHTWLCRQYSCDASWLARAAGTALSLPAIRQWGSYTFSLFWKSAAASLS